jgi:hypothetical protein
MPCNLVHKYPRVGGTCYLRLQARHEDGGSMFFLNVGTRGPYFPEDSDLQTNFSLLRKRKEREREREKTKKKSIKMCCTESFRPVIS